MLFHSALEGQHDGLYYRGRSNLDTVLDSLLERGMNKATDVVFTGGSAGGLAVWVTPQSVCFDVMTQSKPHLVGCNHTDMSTVIFMIIDTDRFERTDWVFSFRNLLVQALCDRVSCADFSPFTKQIKNNQTTILIPKKYTLKRAVQVSQHRPRGRTNSR